MPQPFATRCSNDGRDDYWTCPGCYHDLGDVGEDDHICPNCDRRIRCSIDHQPVCVTELIETSPTQEINDD